MATPLEANLRSDALDRWTEPWRDADLTASGVPLVNGFIYRTVENMTNAKAGGNGHHYRKRCRQTFETTVWLVPFPPVDRGDKPGAHGGADGDAVSSRVNGIDPPYRTVDEYLFSRAEDPSLQNHSQVQPPIQWQQRFPWSCRDGRSHDQSVARDRGDLSAPHSTRVVCHDNLLSTREESLERCKRPVVRTFQRRIGIAMRQCHSSGLLLNRGANGILALLCRGSHGEPHRKHPAGRSDTSNSHLASGRKLVRPPARSPDNALKNSESVCETQAMHNDGAPILVLKERAA